MSEIPEVKTKVVLEKMFNHLDEKKDKENIKGIVIGRAFCLAAIIKSGTGFIFRIKLVSR